MKIISLSIVAVKGGERGGGVNPAVISRYHTDFCLFLQPEQLQLLTLCDPTGESKV